MSELGYPSIGNEHLSLFKNLPKEKRSLAQSECLKQAPQNIKQIYNHYYIGNEKEFIELLFYIQTNNNLENVLAAIVQLNKLRPGFVTTEKVLFICEQSTPSGVRQREMDDTMKQSEDNLKAYTEMFNQHEEGVASHGQKTTSH